MKKIAWGVIVLILCACGSAKEKEAETKGKEVEANSSETLEKRLTAFMNANDKMDIEKVLDYTYPKLFTLAPKAAVLQQMKESFSSEEVSIELDSLKVIKIHPEFTIGDASYAKLRYSMHMLMDFKDEKSGEKAGLTRDLLASEYGEENVSVDNATGIIRIKQVSDMVAVKDEYAKEWSFVNLKEGDPMTDKLFSKEVQEKLATYN